MKTSKNSEGFTIISHDLYNGILVSDLNLRQRLVAELILRLTNGCHREWAKVKKADLTIVGISNQHAKEVIEPMVQRGILIINEKTSELKINMRFFTKHKPSNEARMEKLRKVIGKNLPKLTTSRNGNTNVPELGSEDLPKREEETSQNRNNYPFLKREDWSSDNKGFQTTKDILKKRINISDR